jgi:GNAT superfamily N-acetyltransferase
VRRAVRIYDLDSLPPALLPQLATLAPTDGDAPQGIEFIRRARRAKLPASDYYAVYAVEDGKVLSRVESLQLPFAGVARREVVVGISDVLTRPEGIGRGLARGLLDEVHRRERRRGRRWSFLWTRRSWGAHRLYESMGYEDVYSYCSAVAEPSTSARRRAVRNYRLSPENSATGIRLERLLAEGTSGRLGFVPRAPDSFRTRFLLGWRKPGSHRLLFRGERAVGYAHVSDESRWNLSVNEVVVTEPTDREPMLERLEGLAGRRRLTFQATTFVRDAGALLLARKYQILPMSHAVLMAKDLTSRRPVGSELRSVFTDPRFSCHRGDMF